MATRHTIDDRAQAPGGGPPTHLAVRSHGKVFRRAGLTFSNKYRAIPLKDLTPAQIVAIEAELALESRRVNGEQLEIMAAEGGAEHVSEIPEAERLRARCEALEVEVDKLRGQLKQAIERGKLAPP